MTFIKQSYNDSHSRKDSLLSLLQCPLLSDEVTAYSIPITAALPLSFENPFNDPRLEPLPLRAENSDALNISQIASVADDCISSLIQPSKRNLGQDFNFDGFLSHQDTASFPSTRQQEGGLSRTDDVAENIARFRPYQDKKWKGTFQRLIKFKNEFGHCCVPHSYAENPALARWVKRQRHQYKKFMENDPTSTLTTSRLEKLESVGFVWHSHAAAWLEKLDELKNFKQARGHCNVPSSYPENPALSTWVKCQRRQYKLRVSGLQSTMTMDRFGVLKSMGFVFEPRLAAARSAQLELEA
ncbi:unnamed protein product [Cylindrotheca closterium]|uniref:Helicase-associated domain-containing protein n=1 Tax=Cylindrotheca closterium TaxID=2856 RepID=A0AAD2FS50_9STRA|nr:unnamed protein product [Cylindrotheca closterium]